MKLRNCVTASLRQTKILNILHFNTWNKSEKNLKKPCFASLFFVPLPLQLRCKRRLRAAAQRRPSELASAFTLHRSCNVNEDENLRSHERNFSRPRERWKSWVKGCRWQSDLIRKMETEASTVRPEPLVFELSRQTGMRRKPKGSLVINH